MPVVIEAKGRQQTVAAFCIHATQPARVELSLPEAAEAVSKRRGWLTSAAVAGA
jgi:hypothetical protein